MSMDNLTLKETAVGLHEMYVSLQEAGFTKKEALELIERMLKP